MMYYIEKPNTWRAANRKCAEIIEFVGKFRNCLIADDLSRDALIQELRDKVDELNAAYPRTKKLVVDLGITNDYVSCHPDPRTSDSDSIFTMSIYPVLRTYQFAESAAVLEEGDAK